jgi:Protein of unknown function (DUF3551)
MRKLQIAGLLMAIAVTLVASATPSSAAIIYPWCANYGGGRNGGGGGSNCGFTSFKQCEATRAGNGGFCTANPFYEPYPPPQTYAPPIQRKY